MHHHDASNDLRADPVCQEAAPLVWRDCQTRVTLEAVVNYQDIAYAVDDRVAVITLNRPDRMNAFGRQLRDEFPHAVARADRDPDVRVIIVAGAGGRAFSTGYDQK